MVALLLAAALNVTPLLPTCELPDGTRLVLEVAVTEQERALGLMYRDHLAPNRGMLFLFDSDDRWPFWMKNTVIALDFIWLDAQGMVVEVRSNIQPCRLDPCPSYSPIKPARAFLEIAAGAAAAHGIVGGSRLVFQGVDSYPVTQAKP